MVGGVVGVLMLLGLSDALFPRSQVRLAHMHLNLVGWITLTIMGTMRLFFSSVLGVPARSLNPLWAEYWPLVLGTTLLALGWLLYSMILVGIGTLLQAIGVLAYSAVIIRQWRAHEGACSRSSGSLRLPLSLR